MSNGVWVQVPSLATKKRGQKIKTFDLSFFCFAPSGRSARLINILGFLEKMSFSVIHKYVYCKRLHHFGVLFFIKSLINSMISFSPMPRDL